NVGSAAIVTKFNSSGQVDTAFGTGGTAQLHNSFLTSLLSHAHAITLQPDGKILIAGHEKTYLGSTVDMLVARWNADGSPDLSFNAGVKNYRIVNFSGNGDDYAYALALAPNGKIVLAGVAWNGTGYVW